MKRNCFFSNLYFGTQKRDQFYKFFIHGRKFWTEKINLKTGFLGGESKNHAFSENTITCLFLFFIFSFISFYFTIITILQLY
jgi:hypothetical protein